MIGLIKGLFSSKQTEVKSEEQVEAAPPVQPQKSGAYFLDRDDAITLGNVEYMRTAKAVRKTFPTLGNPEEKIEQIEKISATDKTIGEEQSSLEATEIAPIVAISDVDATVTERKRSDSSLDLFRDMARDMRKA